MYSFHRGDFVTLRFFLHKNSLRSPKTPHLLLLLYTYRSWSLVRHHTNAIVMTSVARTGSLKEDVRRWKTIGDGQFRVRFVLFSLCAFFFSFLNSCAHSSRRVFYFASLFLSRARARVVALLSRRSAVMHENYWNQELNFSIARPRRYVARCESFDYTTLYSEPDKKKKAVFARVRIGGFLSICI